MTENKKGSKDRKLFLTTTIKKRVSELDFAAKKYKKCEIEEV
jgi:hypothetical protein